MASPEAKKKVAALIVAGMPSPDKLKKAEPDSDEPDSDDADEGKNAAEASAFGDLRQAIKSGDDAAGAAAFKEFLEICGYTKGE
jgi:hypothetical protein